MSVGRMPGFQESVQRGVLPTVFALVERFAQPFEESFRAPFLDLVERRHALALDARLRETLDVLQLVDFPARDERDGLALAPARPVRPMR